MVSDPTELDAARYTHRVVHRYRIGDDVYTHRAQPTSRAAAHERAADIAGRTHVLTVWIERRTPLGWTQDNGMLATR